MWLLPASLSRSTRKSTSGSKNAKGVWFGDEKSVRELRDADKKGKKKL